MAAVYKALAKSADAGGDKGAETTGGARKNKQRVLILGSRGITHRYGVGSGSRASTDEGTEKTG
jgi:ribosome biogenesis protein BRX1